MSIKCKMFIFYNLYTNVIMLNTKMDCRYGYGKFQLLLCKNCDWIGY